MLCIILILLGSSLLLANAQCPVVQGTITTAPYQVCSGQNGAIAIQVSPATGGTYSGKFTNGRVFTGLSPMSGVISPAYIFSNNTSAIVSKTVELEELTFTDAAAQTTCPALAADLTGSTTVSILPLPSLDAGLTTADTICSGSSVTITITNPNGTGGTYSQQIQYNGAGHTAQATAGSQAYGTLNDVLTNNTALPITVRYVFTPAAAGCTGTPDTVYVAVKPKPVLSCPANQTVSTDASACSATVNGIDPVIANNSTCNGIAPVISYNLSGATTGTGTGSASGKIFNKGITTVTYYITDGTNSIDSCRFTVTVKDAQAPTFTVCPANITIISDSLLCGAIATYTATATDDCGGPVTLTYSKASGSFFPLGTTTVLITAKDSTGNTATCSFTVTVANSTIYVNDSSRTGDVYTTLAGSDATGNGTRCAPFATVQKAIATAVAGNTIYVDAGTYREDVVVDKPLTLKGANFGTDPNGTGPFARPSILQPLTSSPAAGSAILYLEPAASGSVVDGFMLDGNNTTSTSGVVINGADVDAAEGIGAYAGIANTTISNNIIKNLNYAGIDFDNFYTNSIATTGNLIINNWFTNIFPAQYGAGIAIADNCYTSIINNKMDSVRLGIQTSKFFQADPGNSHSISNNTVTSSRTGIWYYFIYANATAFDLTNNTVNTYTGAANNNGILIDSVLGTAGVTITGNKVNGAFAGINLYNNPTSNTVTVGANTLTGCSYGIFANNYDGFNANAGAASTYLVKGTNIQNATLAGIYIKDNGTSNHQAVAVQISDSTVINNSTTGLKLEGSAASAAFSGTMPAVFKGQSIYIDQVSNGSSLPATAITATGVVFDSTTGSAATLAQNFKIEDKIRHKIDSAGMGLVLVKANNAFVTLNSHIAANTTASIQRAADAVTAGFVVNVDSGSYKEDVVLNKKITLQGTGYTKTTISGSKGGNGSTIQVAASGILLDGLKITREGNNPTDWNNTTLNTNGIYIQGQTSDAEIRNCWVYGNYNGINISNSNGNNLHDNLIENNWTGLLFSHITDSTLVQQNVVRNNFSYGFLFADSSNGTSNSPQRALVSNFNRNTITGNWYSDVVDRQTGQVLAEGFNWKDFGCNWYGSPAEPVVNTADPLQPTYSTQIPVLFGGTATAPAARPGVITGSQAANIRYASWLINGTDTAASLPGFQPLNNVCKGLLHFYNLTSNAQLCAMSGAIKFAFQGGVAPYNLSYTGAATGTATGVRSTDTIPNLVAGTYNITITDSNGYVGIDTIVVKYHPVTNAVSKNSYATLQAAIDGATNGDTLQVCGGNYKEELVVNKPLTLLGPNATEAACGVRTTEAVLYPGRVDFGYTGSHYSLLRIAADSVMIKGFTFNGDNPDSTYGLAVNGANIDIAEGITVLAARKKLAIENNIFKNIAGTAIAVQPTSDTAASFKNTILNNRFSNIDNTTANAYGTGIRVGNNFYARIENNCMDSVGVGIQSANYSLNDTSLLTPTLANNTITSRKVGIWHISAKENAPVFIIQGNTLKSALGAAKSTGLVLGNIQNSAGATVQHNTITNSQYGIRLFNNAVSSQLKIAGGTLSNCDTAIFASNYDSSITTAVASNYTLDSVTITGGNVGVVVKDDKSAANIAPIAVAVQGNIHITNTATGVQVIGGQAGIAFNGVAPATFTGQTKYIDLASNGATVPAGLVNATAVQFDNLTGATATLAQNFAIEDKINHKIDSAELGFVLVKAKQDFVTVNSHLSPATTAKVQRGVLAADTGYTVNIAPGAFIDNITVNKRLTLQGAGKDSTTIRSGTANGNIVTVAADSVAISDLYVEGNPDSITNLSATRGIYFNSATKKTTLTNLKASLHQYCVLADNAANAIGITISNASFSNSGNGVGVNVSGKVANLAISNTAFNSNLYGLTSNADPATGAANANGLTGVTVTNCTFTGNSTKGAYFEKLNNAVLSNNTFTNNGTVATGAGLEINLKYGVYSNITINGNVLTNNGYVPGNGPAIAVKARNDVPNYTSFPAALSNVQLTNNEVTTAPVAISVGYNVDRQSLRIDSNKIVATNGIVSYAAASSSVTQIHSNSIVATQYAIVNGDTASGTATLNATCNWINSTDLMLVAGKMSGPATYIPYLAGSADNQLATTGFQPVAACAACTTLTATKVKTNNTCNGGSTGVITATAAGGLSPYVYAIYPTPATMVQPSAGMFTGLPAGIYTVTSYGSNGCSTVFRTDTITQPTATVPDGSLSVPIYTDNFFLSPGTTATFLVQITENAGNPITSALLSLTKQDGYTLGFNPALQSLTIRGRTYAVDNTHWTLNNTNPVFSRLTLTNPNQVACLRSVYLAFTLTRTDNNKANFVLTPFLNNINGETININNSSTFYLIGQ